ncbi:MAG: aminotransferase class IV [Myxococcota bacterium]|nr:aminotransferase class IV [Myxococcota bacterium]
MPNQASRPPPDRQIWIDGGLVPWQDATVHVLSHSLQRGSLVFDYLSVCETPQGAAVFRLRDHVERFLRSAELVGLPLSLDVGAIEAGIVETVGANPGARAVKLSAYLPSVEVDVVPQDPRVSVAIAAYDPVSDVIKRNPSGWKPRATARLWIEKERRNRRDDIVPAQAKVAANYTSPMLAKWRARHRGFDEILLVDEHGFIAEAPTSNVFWVDAEETVHTPPEQNVLLGVTRRSILDLAKHDGLECAETPARPEELLEAAEVFLTGTTAGVWPVDSIDERPVGAGAPGPVSARLRDRFLSVTQGEDPTFHHWLTIIGENA